MIILEVLDNFNIFACVGSSIFKDGLFLLPDKGLLLYLLVELANDSLINALACHNFAHFDRYKIEELDTSWSEYALLLCELIG